VVLATPLGWLGLITLSSIAPCINAGSIGMALHMSKAAAAGCKLQSDLQASASLGEVGVTVHPMHAVHMHSKSAEVSRSETLLGVDADMPAVEVLADNLLDITTSCACTP